MTDGLIEILKDADAVAPRHKDAVAIANVVRRRYCRERRIHRSLAAMCVVAIASAINSFDRERIDASKRNALAAAEEFCWERESSRLVDAYRQLLPEIALG